MGLPFGPRGEEGWICAASAIRAKSGRRAEATSEPAWWWLLGELGCAGRACLAGVLTAVSCPLALSSGAPGAGHSRREEALDPAFPMWRLRPGQSWFPPASISS